MTRDPLGDGVSSVRLLWVAGSDLEVVNDARVSFDKESEWLEQPQDPGFKWLKAADERLIHYLASHGHWTPFAGSIVKMQIKMPLFVAREWYRHTVGFNRNEVSRRYVDSEPEFYVPWSWRARPENGMKQGSGPTLEGAGARLAIAEVQGLVANIASQYRDLLQRGIAPEMARMILPQSMYTEFRETASLAAYARLCGLRLSPDAQQETRRYAEAVSELIAPHFPVSWKALSEARA